MSQFHLPFEKQQSVYQPTKRVNWYRRDSLRDKHRLRDNDAEWVYRRALYHEEQVKRSAKYK